MEQTRYGGVYILELHNSALNTTSKFGLPGPWCDHHYKLEWLFVFVVYFIVMLLCVAVFFLSLFILPLEFSLKYE